MVKQLEAAAGGAAAAAAEKVSLPSSADENGLKLLQLCEIIIIASNGGMI